MEKTITCFASRVDGRLDSDFGISVDFLSAIPLSLSFNERAPRFSFKIPIPFLSQQPTESIAVAQMALRFIAG